MSTSSQTKTATSRQIESLLLNALAEAGQSHVAASIGVDESTISKWKGSDYFAQISRVLSALGMKVIPTDERTVVLKKGDMVMSRSEVRSIKTIACKYLIADLEEHDTEDGQ